MSNPTVRSWLDQALRVLEAGGAVAVPTESFFALAVDATRPDALEHLFFLKHRDLAKGIGLLVPRVSWRTCSSSVPALAEKLAREFWPGPLSLVLPAAPHLDERLVVDGHVSLRVPGPSLAAQLVDAFGKPLTATSANVSGQPPCRTPAEVREQLSATEQLYIVDAECPGGLVSTLVRANGDSWKVLREGAVSSERIRQCLD
jgi:L-threonylcarbamoyladenylate synthase